jgi:cytochrome c-type protein NapB
MSAQPGSSSWRAVEVLLAATMGLAVVGYLVGTRAPEPGAWARPSTTPAPGLDAPPSRPYAEIPLRRDGPRSVPTSRWELLKPQSKLDPGATPTAQERGAALQDRWRTRAYDGAPPVIPHALDERGSTGCLTCHAHGIVVAGRTAPVVSHPAFLNCTQCHAPSVLRPGGEPATPHNGFLALREGGGGTRAWSGAPPQMPHPRAMRQQCLSCHGVTGRPGLRTPHPDRQNCEQCHAESPGAPPPPPPPPPPS